MTYEAHRRRQNARLSSRVLLLAFIIGPITLGWWACTHRHYETRYVQVTIEKGGDTWTPLVRLADESIDLSWAMTEIRRVNNLSISAVQPGQRLLVPVSRRPIWARQDRHVILTPGSEVATK